MITLLTALAPLLLSLGLKIVSWFTSNADDKLTNQKTFLSLLAGHVNDAQKSVDEKLSYDAQVKQMEDQNGNPPNV